MRFLIIGGTNFIGPYVVRYLAAAGHHVTVFHRGETAVALPPGVATINGDRQRLSDFRADFRRLAPEVVIDMIPYTEGEARAVAQTFRGIARRVVAVSSMDVYRAYGCFTRLETGTPATGPLSEDAPLRTQLYPYRARAPQSTDDFVYHYDKILVERVVMNDDKLRGTALRLPQVYGPGDPQRRLRDYVRRMVEGRPAILLEAAQAQWRWTRGYVENVAAAIALAASDERAAGRIYNVGEVAALTESEWVRRLARVVGWQGRISVVPRELLPESLRLPYDWRHHLAGSTERMRAELDFIEPAPAEVALKQAVAWEQQQAASAGAFAYAAEDEALARIESLL